MELVEAVEQYLAASDMLHPTFRELTAVVSVRQSMSRPRGPKPLASKPHTKSLPPTCHAAILEIRDWPVLPLWETGPYFLAVWKAWWPSWPTCPVTVNQHDVEALLDSGSARTVVRESVLEVAQGGLVLIVCVHGDTHECPPPSQWWSS